MVREYDVLYVTAVMLANTELTKICWWFSTNLLESRKQDGIRVKVMIVTEEALLGRARASIQRIQKNCTF